MYSSVEGFSDSGQTMSKREYICGIVRLWRAEHVSARDVRSFVCVTYHEARLLAPLFLACHKEDGFQTSLTISFSMSKGKSSNSIFVFSGAIFEVPIIEALAPGVEVRLRFWMEV